MTKENNFLSKLSKRGMIRILVFTTAVILVLALFGILQCRMALRYSRRLQYDYEQQLNSLTQYMSEIDNGLKMSAYISTPSQFAKISSLVWQNCGSAKACVAALPTAVAELDNTYRFLSQAGEYMRALSAGFSSGTDLTERDRNTLKTYSDYAYQLTVSLSDLRDEMDSQGLWDNMAYKVAFSDPQDLEQEFFYTSVSEGENALSDIPDPVYNGPYSSHITSNESEILNSKEEVSEEEAAQTAAKLLGTKPEALSFKGETGETDKFVSFLFEGNGIYAAITKKGGIAAYFLKENNAQKAVLTEKQALKKCGDFLSQHGFNGFKETYYSVSDSVMTAEFCYVDNGVICLTDVIKISIELDSGTVYAMDTRQYLLNHRNRSLFDPKFTKDQALHVLSPNLTMQSVATVVIPSDNVSDTLCYQFICRADDNTNVIVYVNCNTLEEEKLVLIDESSTGVYL